MVVEGGIKVSKMCIVMASTIGEPLGDGDKSGMVALFERECMIFFLYPVFVMTVVI